MNAEPLELRTLRVSDEDSFRRAVAAFRAEVPAFTFAFEFDEAVSFPDYVTRLARQARGLGVPASFVPSTYYVGVVEGEIVGRLSLRHTLNDFLASVGGHIGYGVIPSQRGRGYATAMLRQVMPICAARGLNPVLITCDVDNVASRKVIEACGGIFERVVDCTYSGIPKRRYWLKTSTEI